MGVVRMGAFEHASAKDLLRFLTDVDAAELIVAVRSASDADLLAVTHDAGRGSAVVEGVMRRIGEFAVPGQLAEMDCSLRWETIGLPGGHGVRFHSGTTQRVPEAMSSDLVVQGTALQLLRLVAGQLDVAVAYLGDSLHLEGSSDATLALAALFAVDGATPLTGQPVNPRDIDPVQVARALTGVSTDHLRSVMASGFRPVILEEIFDRMPAYVNGRKAAGVQITVGFRLTGRPDGEVDRYVLRLRDGQATVLAGEAADAVGRDDRDATVTCEAQDFLRLATGHLSAVTGVLRGQLKVRGDKVAALRLNSAFDIPTAAA
ncbi:MULTISPECIES: SCP2 sterol-binding domain-containing protein [unclassified Nocardioides]|uniref:SCP2 sterol-binding domain-containing protein n=1 Tax=unclassified Nocardioides TaxID=2615069 RepID=UPI00138ED182|nr:MULTISPECIES: alkyl sulfatase C-terminal domain-containing protein [unclassified Nocardioides]